MTDQIHDDQIPNDQIRGDQLHDDRQLVRELAQLPDVPAPLNTVDITRAVRDGRTRLRRRRMAAGAAVSGLVAAAAALALLGGGLTGTAAPRHVEPARTPHGRLTTMAGFGWLPPGFNMTSWQWSERHGQVTEGSVADIVASSQAAPSAWLGVSPKPGGLDLGKNAYSVTTVNARKAYWLASGPRLRGGWDVMLWWQLADGRWMFMNGSGLPGADLKQNMLRTAAAYDTREQPVRLPFFVSDAGPGFSVEDVRMTTTDGGASWWLTADVRKGGYSASMIMATPGLIFSPDNFKHANCRTQGGMKACTVAGFLRYSKTPNAADAAWMKGFVHFDHLTLLGANPRDWTADVLR